MKIAITCPASLPATQFGGIMFLAIHIGKNLSNNGHDITIYTTDLDFANNSDTFNKKLPKSEKINNFLIKRSHVIFSKFLFFVNPEMYFQMMKDDIDIIHAIGIRSFQALIAIIVSKRKKIPLVITDQGGLTTHPDLLDGNFLKKILIKIQEPMIKLIIKNSSAIIVPNKYENDIFSHYTNQKKIHIVRNGIDLDELKSSNFNFKSHYKINKKFLLFLGRFHHVKGIDILLSAINEIKSEPILKNYIFVIMGVDFGYEKEMESIVKKLDLLDMVKIIKNPPRVHVLSAYNEAEFLILPSRWELSPLTHLEGFAFKKTVISTKSHGIPYTVENNVNSILVENEDSKELGNAILDLARNKIKRDQLAEAGFMFVQNIANSKKMVEEIYQIYNQVLNKSKMEQSYEKR